MQRKLLRPPHRYWSGMFKQAWYAQMLCNKAVFNILYHDDSQVQYLRKFGLNELAQEK